MFLPQPPEHVQQHSFGYCLPACVEMAAAQFGQTLTQQQAARLLSTVEDIGTPFPYTKQLEQRGFSVELVEWCSVDALISALGKEQAVIAAVLTTSGMPGWNDVRTQHVVLVTAVDDMNITYYDPALATGPTTALSGEFLLAWSDMSEQAAFISAS